jgi:hypothetical protein
LNIGISKQTYQSLFGAQMSLSGEGGGESGYDFTLTAAEKGACYDAERSGRAHVKPSGELVGLVTTVFLNGLFWYFEGGS